MAKPKEDAASRELVATPAIERRIFVIRDRQETAALRSQIATSKRGRGGRRYAPYVFTEQRRTATSYAAIEERLSQIEQRIERHDEQLGQIFTALRHLIAPPPKPKHPIGFRIQEPDPDG